MITVSAERALSIDWDRLGPVRDSMPVAYAGSKVLARTPSITGEKRTGIELRQAGDPRLDYAEPDEVDELDALIRRLGITGAEAARRLGVNGTYISRIRRGAHHAVSRQQLRRLIERLEEVS